MSNTVITLGLPVLNKYCDRAYDYVARIDREFELQSLKRRRSEAYKWFIDTHGVDAKVSSSDLRGTIMDYNLTWASEVDAGFMVSKRDKEAMSYFTLTDLAVALANDTSIISRERFDNLRRTLRLHRENMGMFSQHLAHHNHYYIERHKGLRRAKAAVVWRIRQAAENADLRTPEGQRAVYEYSELVGNGRVNDKTRTSWHYQVFDDGQLEQDKDWEMLRLSKLYRWAGGEDTIDNTGEPRWIAATIVHKFHRLHVSTEDAMQVAYYPTLKHMLEDRPLRTRMGKYLAAYATMLGFTDAHVKRVVDSYQADMSKRNSIELKFTAHDAPSEWTHVYEVGPSSCMSGDDAWCVAVYAHSRSQLRLSYLTDADGDVIARAIVRCRDLGAKDDEHGYLRIYPDPESDRAGKLLQMMLKDAGYSERINLDGCLLAYEEEDEGIVCPYIDSGDGGSQSVSEVERDGQTYLKVGGCEHSATNTTGYIELEYCTCEDCGDRIRGRHDAHSVQDGDRTVCEGCLDSNYVYAYFGSRGNQDYFHQDDVIYCKSDGEDYVEDDAHYYDVYQCQESDNWYHQDDMVNIEGEWYHQDHAQKLDYPHDGEDYALVNDAKELPDGKYCHEYDYDEIMESDYAEAEA